MTDERNLPKIAEEAALKALDEATCRRRYYDGTPVPVPETPWNAGLAATVPDEAVVIRINAEGAADIRFYRDERGARRFARIGAHPGDPMTDDKTRGCRVIVARIVEDWQA